MGVVTTTRLTHATPAAMFAHSPERDWESDRYLPESDWALGCRDIAYQLTNSGVGSGLDVVLGTFSRSHMTYVAERTPDTTEPTLAEMTSAAIDLLAEAEDGYFLMVEGGRIDHGHHDGKPGYALLETQAFGWDDEE